MGKKIVAGIDLGGTNIVAGIFDESGEMIASKQCETQADLGPIRVVENMVSSVKELVKELGCSANDLLGVGIGTPGALDRKSGVVFFAPNLHWKDFPLMKEVHDRLGCPACIENDANAAIYGEAWKGSAAGCDNVVGFTLGTGVGGGIIVDGNILHGCCDAGAELGHLTIDPEGPLCGCGNKGCIEAYSSATGIKNYLKEQYADHKDSLIYKLVDGDLEKVSPKVVYDAATRNDSFANHVFDRVGYYLGIATANAINLFNPEVVVFVGGMTSAGDLIMNPLLAETRKRSFEVSFAKAKISYGKLGNQAGIIGIGGIAFQKFMKLSS